MNAATPQLALMSEFVNALVVFVILGGLFLGVCFRMKRSGNPLPSEWAVRILGTLASFSLWFSVIRPLGEQGGFASFVALLVTVVCGVTLALLWVPVIMTLVTGPLIRMVQGEDSENPSQPFYKAVHGWRKNGKPEEALAEVEKQLEGFPMDGEGLLLKMQILAEDLCNFDEAEQCLGDYLSKEDIGMEDKVQALNQYATWQLRIGIDPEGASQTLRRIGELFPGTAHVQAAEERIGKLPSKEFLRRNMLAVRKK